MEGIKVRLKPTKHALLMEEIPIDTAGISRGRDRKACLHHVVVVVVVEEGRD